MDMSNTDSGTFDIGAALRIAAVLDARLKPIATRSVDMDDLARLEKLRSSP
jgi:hypothetical protein